MKRLPLLGILSACAMIVAGVAMLSAPAGLIVAGVALLAALTFDPDRAGRMTWPR